MRNQINCSLVFLLTLGLGAANGASVLGYNFSSNLDPSTLDANASGSTITGTYATTVPTTSTTAWARSSTDSNLFLRGGVTASVFDSSLYFAFTLTPDSGYRMDLNELALDFAAQRTNGSALPNPFTSNMVLRSSVDGFASDVGSVPDPVTVTSVGTGQTFTNASFSLSGPAHQNITTATTFRIYIWDDSLANAVSTVSRLDNIIVDGTVSAIPETGTLPLVLAISLLCVLRMRSRKAGSK